MDAPPPIGDPYEGIFQLDPNVGTRGVAYAWDQMRQFWSVNAQQAWSDMDALRKVQLIS